MINVTAWLAFVSGFLSFISPCVLPLVPAYVGYMTNRVTLQALAGAGGVTSGSMTVSVGQKHRVQMALHGIAFVVGFTFVFVVFGLALTAGTQLVATTAYGIERDIIPHVGGIIIILLGFHFLGVIVPVLHRLERQPALERLGKMGLGIKRVLEWLQSALYADTRLQITPSRLPGLTGSTLMGIIFAAGWTPCIGPIYGTILTMAAARSGALVQAGGLLTMYSLGLGVPFILTAVALDQAEGILKRLKKHLNTIKAMSGILLIAIGVLVYTGDLQRFSQLGAANATLSYRLDLCATQFFNGELAFGDIGTCLSQQ